jgi:hypothetical protein
MLSLVTRRHISEDLMFSNIAVGVSNIEVMPLLQAIYFGGNCLLADVTYQKRSQEADCRSRSHIHVPVVCRIGRFSAAVPVAEPWSLS